MSGPSSILNRFGDVLGLDDCCFFDVGDGAAGYFEDVGGRGRLVLDQ